MQIAHVARSFSPDGDDMGNETNRGEGAAEELGGKIKKNVGKVIGNEQMEAEGKAKKACEIRASWTKATDRVCINCMSAAPSQACDCPDFKAFGGLCKSHNDARRNEPSCTDAIGNCTRACAKNDCTCVESCYAQAP